MNMLQYTKIGQIVKRAHEFVFRHEITDGHDQVFILNLVVLSSKIGYRAQNQFISPRTFSIISFPKVLKTTIVRFLEPVMNTRVDKAVGDFRSLALRLLIEMGAKQLEIVWMTGSDHEQRVNGGIG